MFDNMDEKTFIEVVAAECKGDAPAGVTEVLGQVLDRWRDALVSLHQQAQNDLTGARASYDLEMAEARQQGLSKADRLAIDGAFQQRRRDIGAFRHGIDRRLREIKRLIAAERHGRYVDTVQDERDALREALRRHGQHIEDCTGDPCSCGLARALAI